MTCRAWASTKARRCRNPAKTPDGLCGYCDWRRKSGHLISMVEEDIQGPPLPPSLPPSPDGGAAPPAPLPPRELDEIPEAPAVEDEPITTVSAPLSPPLLVADAGSSGDEPPPAGVDDLDRLDSLAAGFWGAISEDPATADADALEATTPIAALAGTSDAIAGRWDPPRVERYLKMLNGVVERSGKEPLTAGEIKEGGMALAPLCDEWFGRIDPANPYTVALLWIAMTFGTRYAGDILRGVRVLIARRRRGAPEIEPEEEVAPDPAPTRTGDTDGLPLAWAVLR